MSHEERMAHCSGRLSVPLLLFSALNPFSSGLSVFFLLIYKTPGSSPVVQWLGLSDFTVVTWVWSLVGNEDPASTTRPKKQKQPPTTNLFMINKYWLSLNFSISKPPIVSVSKVTRQKSRVESTGFAVGWYWLLLLVWPLGLMLISFLYETGTVIPSSQDCGDSDDTQKILHLPLGVKQC